MSESDGHTQAKPGAVLKAQRLRMGWTLAEASARTGLPVSTLSKVENDKISLTYDKLARLSRGLEIDISRLFGGADTPQQSISGRRSITRAAEGRSIDTPNYAHLYVAADLLNKSFIPVVAEIRARSLEEFGALVSHSGEEFTYVLEGAVDLHTSLYAPVRLNVGDSIYFDSGIGHAYIAVGEGVCRVLSICTGAEAQLIAASEAQTHSGEVKAFTLPPQRTGSDR
ncbi:transcriptional regulator of HTH_3 family [alpha proteobacterium U9-1i]|nr:transcriptional regulator of HTH_3 family [alpha proteobacterium U9-1i]